MNQCILNKEEIRQLEELKEKVFKGHKIVNIQRLGGLTNKTFKVKLDNNEVYAYRIPGEGTSEIICREEEKVFAKHASKIHIDTKLIYFDEEGFKISKYIKPKVLLDEREKLDKKIIKKMAETLYKLHNSKLKVDRNIEFKFEEEEKIYLNLVLKNEVIDKDEILKLSKKLKTLKLKVDFFDENQKVLSHNDPLLANWIIGKKDKIYLIDWEYSGKNSKFWDLATLSEEGQFSSKQDNILLKSYFKRSPDQKEKEGFLVYKMLEDYLWGLWGYARIPYGNEKFYKEYGDIRFKRLRKNLKDYEDFYC